MNKGLVEELLQINDVADRINIIAKDLESHSDKYKKIDPWVLLEEVLNIEISYGTGVWERYLAAPDFDLEDQGETPVLDQIHLLFHDSKSQHIAQWNKHLEEFLAGKRNDDIRLTSDETLLLKKAIILDGDGGWFIVKYTLNGADGSEIHYEVCIGDAGEEFDLIGPYQLRDGETNFGDDLIFQDAT